MNLFDDIFGNNGNSRAVWNKGQIIAGYNPLIWRRDYMGNAIRYSDYGDRLSVHGWEIDHITPVALGGSDDLANLRPLHWRANAQRGGWLGPWFS